MLQILSLGLQIAKLDGPHRSENLYRCSMQVKYQNGTCQQYDHQEHPLRLSEVELLAQHLLKTFSASALKYSEERRDVGSIH